MSEHDMASCPYWRVFLESPEVLLAEVRRLRAIDAAARHPELAGELKDALGKSYADYLVPPPPPRAERARS